MQYKYSFYVTCVPDPKNTPICIRSGFLQVKVNVLKRGGGGLQSLEIFCTGFFHETAPNSSPNNAGVLEKCQFFDIFEAF
jgi:hypothetical protein